ncbi:MAG: helix-turn-helix transcriptional regulator [Candidatus Thiodiazotropha sp. (ex Dulcina madagascariensis)]|nr:helix-turn-helix transcriptional regulator [Candidatus Thiodiazotropha sp. (ex Dulcina madagascariensis)]
MKKTNPTSSGAFARSPCPVACVLDIIGDKWTLLVVRDLFAGKRTYGEFQASFEKIPTNILAERLKRLIEYEIIVKSPYQQRPVRYEYVLTTKGKELGPILKAMAQWGEKYIPGSKAISKW